MLGTAEQMSIGLIIAFCGPSAKTSVASVERPGASAKKSDHARVVFYSSSVAWLCRDERQEEPQRDGKRQASDED